MTDHSRYREATTVEFDREAADFGTKKVNELLAQGWEIIDAKITQNATHRERKTENPIIQWASFAFIMGKPR